MTEEILYTPEELATKLKLSKYTIYEMIKRGDIPAHRIGRSLRISQTQLDFYLIGTRMAENVYEADLIQEDGGRYALSKGVKICVATDLAGHVKIAIDPEDIILAAAPVVCSARNQLIGKVADIIFDERCAKVLLDVGIPMLALITRSSMVEMDIKRGDTLYAIFKAMAVKVRE